MVSVWLSSGTGSTKSAAELESHIRSTPDGGLCRLEAREYYLTKRVNSEPRARGFLIQTENVEIKNCTFYGTSNSAVKAAPAFVKWHEVVPCHNLYVHDNTFIKCAFTDPAFPVLAVYTRHSGNDANITGLHSNIRIENNMFKQADGTCIGISSANKVTVSGNRFIHRCNTNYAAVITLSCTGVNITDNKDIEI